MSRIKWDYKINPPKKVCDNCTNFEKCYEYFITTPGAKACPAWMERGEKNEE